MNYKISVIIPTFGRANSLTCAIDSVFAQSYKNIEVIIIDDNSDEDEHNRTKKALECYMSLPNFKYFHDGINGGGAVARNKGINIATGEYITFLDDDDVYLQTKIQKQLSHMLLNNLDVSVCDMFINRSGKFIDIRNCYARVGSLSSFILDGNAYTPMIMSKKSVLLDVGLFTDTPRYQDHVLMLKLFQHQCKIGQLNEKLFIHNDHAGERIKFSKKSELGYRIRQIYENKNLDVLDTKQLRRYHFNNFQMEAKLSRANGYYLDSMKFIIYATRSISSYKDIIRIIKTFIRINFYPKRII